MKLEELIVYKNFNRSDIFEYFTKLEYCINNTNDCLKENVELKEMLTKAVSLLIDLAESHGYYGNLWQSYLTYLLANNENAYSKACEIKGYVEGSINDAALHDMKIFLQLYHYDIEKILCKLDAEEFRFILDYHSSEDAGYMFNKRIRNRICELTLKLDEAKTASQFKDMVTEFYKEFGVGKFGLHKAFRIVHNNGVEISPVPNIAHVQLDDLVGYEIQKKKLIENTEAFIEGRPCNNCLLYGDAGTGKSSSIKGILNKYYDRGLRIIEVYKHQFKDLNDVIEQIKSRNYRFIIYMDDLSFEEFEIEYKYLKAVIEGGLEKKPENVLIYATSNRRHLVKESFSDRNDYDDEIHSSDTMQEKNSLYSRFGVNIYFPSPEKKEFNTIVEELAKRYNLPVPYDELILEANKWELSHGGLSGRTASQFIDYLRGTR